MNPSTTRRQALATIASAVVAGHASGQAADWPTKTITLVGPTQPGSTGDIIVRTLGQKMAQLSGATVVADNKPGAGGTLGVGWTARQPPDGHMAVITGTGPFILQPLMNKQISYDMEKSLVPVSLLCTFGCALIVAADSPYRTMKDLIAAARAQSGKLAFGSPGAGTLTHLEGELFKIRTGTDLLHVPYKAETAGITAVMAREVAFMVPPSASVQPLIQSGKLRALAVTTDTRMKSLPDVPTMAEAGVADFVVKGWQGAYAPGGTPRAQAQKMSELMRRALLSPDVAERFASIGMDVAGGSPDELYAAWKSDTAIWAEVLKANPQIKVEG